MRENPFTQVTKGANHSVFAVAIAGAVGSVCNVRYTEKGHANEEPCPEDHVSK